MTDMATYDPSNIKHPHFDVPSCDQPLGVVLYHGRQWAILVECGYVTATVDTDANGLRWARMVRS